ncbi:MAG: hypothetical protein IT423_20595 [Pirellulaceae bacterium]|nr:hypothetical protein [Pirellulaceae bacterium]
MATRTLLGLLCIAMIVPLSVTAQEAKDIESVGKCFDDFLQAKWEKKRELMTEEAWIMYTMDALYSNRKLAEAEINQHGLKDYRLPEVPADYKRLPDKNAIDGARKIMKTAYAGLSSKLGSKFVATLERVAETRKPVGNPTLQDIKILADKVTATAECRVDGVNLLVPMRFKKDGGNWRFDGKNELLFFDRQR